MNTIKKYWFCAFFGVLFLSNTLQANPQTDLDLMQAVHASNYALTQEALENDADVNTAEYSSRKTPLIVACHKCPIEIIKLLLDAGANVNRPDIAGNTPLLYALWRKNSKLIALLIDRGANIHHVNNAGGNALLIAARQGKPSIVALLISNKACLPNKAQQCFRPIQTITDHITWWNSPNLTLSQQVIKTMICMTQAQNITELEALKPQFDAQLSQIKPEKNRIFYNIYSRLYDKFYAELTHHTAKPKSLVVQSFNVLKRADTPGKHRASPYNLWTHEIPEWIRSQGFESPQPQIAIASSLPDQLDELPSSENHHIIAHNDDYNEDDADVVEQPKRKRDEEEPIARRTRIQTEPIAKRTRSNKK
jgi:hypothetical protein